MSEEIDFQALIGRLAPAHRAERRPLDRYRDFGEVFLRSEAGRRVLDDILFLGFVTRPHPGAATEIIQKYEGMRRLALMIAAIAMVEPPATPVQRQQSQPKEP